MPEIPVHTRKRVPSGRVGAVPMPYDIARTGRAAIGRGLQRAGSALFEFAQRKQEIRIDREFTKGKLLLAKSDRESLEELRRDNAFQQAEDIPEYFNDWIEQKVETRAKIINKTATSKQSREALGRHSALSEESFRARAGQMAWAKEKDYSRGATFTAAAEHERMGNAAAAESAIRRAMELEYVGLEEGEQRIGQIKHNVDWYVGEAMAAASPQEYLDNVKDEKFLPNLNPSEKLRLRRMAEQNNQINTDAVENEVIYGMHTNRDKTIAERSVIGEKYITRLRLANIPPTRSAKLLADIQKWMTGKARPHDSMVYVDLVKDVERLKSGVGDPTKIRRKITDSFSKLDDQHFESITKMLEADIPSFQADETRKIIRYAERQLVTMDEPTWMQLASIAKGKELEDAISKRQMEFWNLSEYDKELNDWIAKNPDATRDEIYIQSRKLLAHYRRRTIPQIERLMKTKEEEALTMEAREKRAEIAIQKEGRIKVRAPDGEIWTVPKSQEEQAINDGYIVIE